VLYRRAVYVTPGSVGRVRFGACGFHCVVFVDGARVAETGFAYSAPFWVGGIAPSASPWRTVEVLANNEFNASLAPLMEYQEDWFTYAGLFRSVEWHELPPAGALAAADVLVADAAQGLVDVRLRLHDASETVWWRPEDVRAAAASGFAPRYRGFGGAGVPGLPTWVNVTFSFGTPASGNPAASPVYTLAVGADGSATVAGLRVPPPAALWSPESPALHTLSVALLASSLGAPAAPAAPAAPDTLVERFGLRSVTVCANNASQPRVCLNGAPAKLLGFGRHDTDAAHGHAIDDFQRLQDIYANAGMGGNFLRLGHYAQDKGVYELCDEVGVMAELEVQGWDSSPSTYSDPLWVGAGIWALELAVNDTFNHASAILYAFINEGASDDRSVCGTWALFNARYKQLGVQGLTTYANDKGVADVCFGPSGADVLGFNLYPGWYSPAPIDPRTGWTWQPQLAAPAAALNEIAAWMRSAHAGKPFFVSEVGAGGIPGWRDALAGYWSEAYQARLLSASVQTVARDEAWSGVAVWQLFDQRTYNGPESLSRPRGFNNKGVLDEYRRPKHAAWAAVSAAFRGLEPPAFLDDERLPG
jgi:beta-glucuronidase